LLSLFFPEQLPQHFRIPLLRHELLPNNSELPGWILDYLCSIELDDNPFLDGFDEWTQGWIVGAYVAAYRIMQTAMNRWQLHAKPPSTLWIRPSGLTFLSIATAARIRKSRFSHQRTEGLDSPNAARHGTAQ
jgi:hypothetical protein